MRLVVLGLSLSSSWGNGHATTYRALLAAFAARGHDVLFLERDMPWYAQNRDLPDPGFCQLALYDGLDGLDRHADAIAAADAVIVGSYIPDGIEVARRVQGLAGGVVAYYDIDTPVTLAALQRGDCAYVSREVLPGFDLMLSFTAGPTLRRLEQEFGVRDAQGFYCSVDPERYHPTGAARRWDLGYLGTFSDDRQPTVERLLIETARLAPERRFVVAGPQYPDRIAWPANVELQPGRDIMLADTASDVLSLLEWPEDRRLQAGEAARRRILSAHTAAHRAAQLEMLMMMQPKRVFVRWQQGHHPQQET